MAGTGGAVDGQVGRFPRLARRWLCAATVSFLPCLYLTKGPRAQHRRSVAFRSVFCVCAGVVLPVVFTDFWIWTHEVVLCF